jgi:hypothetical protein
LPDIQYRSKLIESLIAGGLVAVGFATGQGPLIALAASAAGIGASWSASLSEQGFQNWRESWFTDQGVLNKDILSALQHALEDATRQLERDWKHHRRYLYLKQTNKEAAQQTLVPLVWIREDAADFFQESGRLATILETDKVLSIRNKDEASARQAIINALEDYFYDYDPELVLFVEDRLADEWLLRFGEILKDAGQEGTRAWRHCQLLWQKSLAEAIDKLEQTAIETKAAVYWLQEWAHQLNQQPISHRNLQGQDSLEEVLNSVRTRLEKIQAVAERIEAGVEALLERIPPVIASNSQVTIQTWLDAINSNFSKEPFLGQNQINLTRELVKEGLLPSNVFLQYINPEIITLYGANRRFKRQELYKRAISLTKYALVLSENILIMPASYLFEVGFISQFLKELKPLEDAGILQFASPTADLYEYVHKKIEYRDELVLFPEYATESRALISRKQSLTWIPKLQRSADVIGSAWRQELYRDNGLWRQILEKQMQNRSILPSKLESTIELVPNHLESRAFIFRYTKPLLQMILEPVQETQINMLICRAYLESYLEELRAMIFVDTPLGRLDCGLSQINKHGNLRTISFRALSNSLRAINLHDYIDRHLNWQELIELRGQPAFRWLMDLIIINSLDPSRPLNSAILKSRYNRNDVATNISNQQSLQEVNKLILHLYDALEPYVFK